jgi:beta-xylosidase
MRTQALSVVFALFPSVHGILHSPFRRQSSSEAVISSNFQDPCVIQVDDTWYAFSGPNGNPTSPPSKVQVATSSDFSSWKVVGDLDALPDPGPWAASPPRVWAPDVAQLVLSSDQKWLQVKC